MTEGGGWLLNWEPAAKAKLERIPIFVRRFAQQRVEELARARGLTVVTSDLVDEAKKSFLGKKETTGPDQALISRLQEEVAKRGHFETTAFSIDACGSAFGCPRTVIDGQQIYRLFQEELQNADLEKILQEKVRGPILTHHKFRVAVAGCPNACSEPQIKDFAVIGRLRPAPQPDLCTACGTCLKACTERALSLQGTKIAWDCQRCVGCGDCTVACPKGALPGKVSYQILIGGRLGRHPRLAIQLAEVESLEEIRSLLRRSLHLIKTEGEHGARIAAIIDRLGEQEVIHRLYLGG